MAAEHLTGNALCPKCASHHPETWDCQAAVARALSSIQGVNSDQSGGEVDDGNPEFQRGLDFAIRTLASAVNAIDWQVMDGSESVDGDVYATIMDILRAARLYDDEDGRWAQLPPLAATPQPAAIPQPAEPGALREAVARAIEPVAFVPYTDGDALVGQIIDQDRADALRKADRAIALVRQADARRIAELEAGLAQGLEAEQNLYNIGEQYLVRAQTAEARAEALAAALKPFATAFELVEEGDCPTLREWEAVRNSVSINDFRTAFRLLTDPSQGEDAK